jgi:hypothetical protein
MVLEDAKSWASVFRLQPHSLLYLELPFEEIMHESAVTSCAKKKHWHEHINFFSERSLRRLLDRAGFEVLALKTLEVTPDPVHAVFQAACKLRSSKI